MRYKSIILLFLVCSICKGQNMVINGDFETLGAMIHCGWSNNSNFENAVTGWNSPTYATPDIFSMLVEPSCWNHPYSTYPSCVKGSQTPYSGNNYAGFHSYLEGSYFEYIQGALYTPILPDKRYYVEFYVSLSDDSEFGTTDLGIGFSASPRYLNTENKLEFTTQLSFTNAVLDTSNWVILEGVFTATAPYNYFIIGNFHNSPSNNLIPVQIDTCTEQSAYYFCDAVTIYECPLDTTHYIDTCSTTLSVELTTNSATSYQWSNQATTKSISVTNSGTYWVDVIKDKCPLYRDSFVVTFTNPPVLNLGQDTVICFGESFSLDAYNSNSHYTWQDNSKESTFEIIQTGTYSVEVSNVCGNIADTIMTNYENCCNIYIPNAFSPNYDGINDRFSPLTNCIFEEYKFSLFDRWGQELFTTNDQEDFWDGTCNGRQFPVGVYVYLLKYKFVDQSSSLKYGNITLFR